MSRSEFDKKQDRARFLEEVREAEREYAKGDYRVATADE